MGVASCTIKFKMSFFFSSRRRHTRSFGDWSSDVCSSDLADRAALQRHAKELLQRAAEKAVEFGKRDVDSEHLLYVLADNDVVQAILKPFKISPQELKDYIDEHAPRGTAEAGKERQTEIGVSPRVKSALDHAMQASLELGHSYVGPEHLLLGLADVPDSFAGSLLRKYGLTSNALRQQVVKVVGQGAEEGRVETPTNTPQLDKYSLDLTKLAREGKLDPVIGRSKEVETTIEVLARRKKNNPVLIGEPGVGKTAIVEGLAQHIVNREVPEVLRDKRLVELNVNSLVAGSKYRGEFEERVKQLMEEIAAKRDELVIFIDELHTIVGAGQGGGEGGLDVANTFKPALARGELNLIGATTLNEYRKHIEKDAALERRFQPVFVDEPTVEQTINILRGLRDRLEAHHKVTIQDQALTAAAELSDRRALPARQSHRPDRPGRRTGAPLCDVTSRRCAGAGGGGCAIEARTGLCHIAQAIRPRQGVREPDRRQGKDAHGEDGGLETEDRIQFDRRHDRTRGRGRVEADGRAGHGADRSGAGQAPEDGGATARAGHRPGAGGEGGQ